MCSHLDPIIYTKETHGISSNQDIPKHILSVMYILWENGFETYLVGGSVRDLLLRKTPKDFDIGTSAYPKQVLRLFPGSKLIGKRFPIIIVPAGLDFVEITSFYTADIDYSDPLDADVGLHHDVKRRDFTVNGLFFDPFNEEIIDYVGGYDDLLFKKVISCIGTPETKFKEDPIRIIRLCKLMATTGLSPSHKEKHAVFTCKHILRTSSGVRIYDSLSKALTSGYAAKFLCNLFSQGILTTIFPNFNIIHKKYKTESAYLKKALWLITQSLDQLAHNKKYTSIFDSNHRDKLIAYWIALILDALPQKNYDDAFNSFMLVIRNSLISIPKKIICLIRAILSGVQIIQKANLCGKQTNIHQSEYAIDICNTLQLKSIFDKSASISMARLFKTIKHQPNSSVNHNEWNDKNKHNRHQANHHYDKHKFGATKRDVSYKKRTPS